MKYERFKKEDSLKGTPFSDLYHVARTTSTDIFTGVSVPVNYSVETDVITTGKPVKTRQGEHFHVRNTQWDFVIGLPVQPFMTTRTAKMSIERDLSARVQTAKHSQI